MSSEHGIPLADSVKENQGGADNLFKGDPPLVSSLLRFSKSPGFLQSFYYDAPYPKFSKFSVASVAIFQVV
jgi:hypothetical protein